MTKKSPQPEFLERFMKGASKNIPSVPQNDGMATTTRTVLYNEKAKRVLGHAEFDDSALYPARDSSEIEVIVAGTDETEVSCTIDPDTFDI